MSGLVGTVEKKNTNYTTAPNWKFKLRHSILKNASTTLAELKVSALHNVTDSL